MSDNRDANLSAAFDALLETNWQRLDALSAGGSRPAPRPSAGAAVATPTARTEPGGRQGNRQIGRCDGLNFSFDL
jgi:hypothetical protein